MTDAYINNLTKLSTNKILLYSPSLLLYHAMLWGKVCSIHINFKTLKNMQFVNTHAVTNLLTSCNRLVIKKPIARCGHMACNNFLMTNLLPVLSTDLLQVDFQNFLSTGLLQVASTSCNKSTNDKLQQAWF